MITLNASGSSVTFTFDGNSTYLNDGTITVPKNSLALIIDESDMATFRKAASNDIFVSANIAEFGMTKDELMAWYKANMVSSGGGGGGVTPEEVEEMIDEAIASAKTEIEAEIPTVPTSNTAFTNDAGYITSSALNGYATEDYVTASTSTKLDVSTFNTYSGNVASALDGKVDDAEIADMATKTWVGNQGYITEHQDISGKLDVSAFTAYSGAVDTTINSKASQASVDTLNGIVTAHTANTEIHVTRSDKAAWNAKSDFSGSYNDLTDKPTIPTVPTNVSDFTNDAGYITIDAISGKVDTTTYNTYTAATDAALATKQATLTAGTGISIVDNIISATGGGGVTSGEVQTMIDESISGKVDADFDNSLGFDINDDLGVYAEGNSEDIVFNTASSKVKEYTFPSVYTNGSSNLYKVGYNSSVSLELNQSFSGTVSTTKAIGVKYLDTNDELKECWWDYSNNAFTINSDYSANNDVRLTYNSYNHKITLSRQNTSLKTIITIMVGGDYYIASSSNPTEADCYISYIKIYTSVKKLQSVLNEKQRQLTAGDGIKLDNYGNISANIKVTGDTHTNVLNSESATTNLMLDGIKNVDMWLNQSYTGTPSGWYTISVQNLDGVGDYYLYENDAFTLVSGYAGSTLNYDSSTGKVTITCPSGISSLQNGSKFAPADDLTNADCFIGLVSYTSNEYTIQDAIDSIGGGGTDAPISAGTGTNSVKENYVNNVASGSYSHAEGQATKAYGTYSHAEGHSTEASGLSAHAEGELTNASGLYSHAEGTSTKANNAAAHAEGRSTTASGKYAHAEGILTVASGQSAHAEGNSTRANGMYSHAEGDNTIANNESEHASGKYNVSNTGESTSAQTLFSVGNGGWDETAQDVVRHNAFEIRKNGDIYLSSGGTDIRLQDHLGGGGGGGISSAECQTLIDQSISGKADSDDVYTTGQTSGATELATAFAATQPKLSAGTGISIDENNVISATGGGGGGGSTYTAGTGIDITNDVISVKMSVGEPSGYPYYSSLNPNATGTTTSERFLYNILGSGYKTLFDFNNARNNQTSKVGYIFYDKTSTTTVSGHTGYGVLIRIYEYNSTNQLYYSNAIIDWKNKEIFFYNKSSASFDTSIVKTIWDYYGKNSILLYTEPLWDDEGMGGQYALDVSNQSGWDGTILNSFDRSDSKCGAYKFYQNANSYSLSSTVYNHAKLTENNLLMINDVNAALGGLKIVKLTESEYTALVTKDSNTLYVVIPDPTNP